MKYILMVYMINGIYYPIKYPSEDICKLARISMMEMQEVKSAECVDEKNIYIRK